MTLCLRRLRNGRSLPLFLLLGLVAVGGAYLLHPQSPGQMVSLMFLVNFLLTAFYCEARVQDEGWEPSWQLVPHPSWSVSEQQPHPVPGRGLRAWLELAIYTVAAGVILVVGLWAMADRREALIPAPEQAWEGPLQHAMAGVQRGAGDRIAVIAVVTPQSAPGRYGCDRSSWPGRGRRPRA
jgi:hypothetical protein